MAEPSPQWRGLRDLSEVGAEMNFKRHIKNERGQTMTEFAFVLPILLVLLFGIIQFGVIFNNYVTLTDAARTASRKGAVSRNSSNPAGGCQSPGYAARTGLKNPGTGFLLPCSSSWPTRAGRS